MELSVVNIGNSKGIRLPKIVLERYNINKKVELIFGKNHITLKPSQGPRKGWEKAFRKMHKNEDDQLLIEDVFEDETFEEWK